MDTENQRDKEYFVIDRISEGVAVCESIKTKEKRSLPLGVLPCDVCEGDVVSYFYGCYMYDKEQTEERRKRIEMLFNSLWD